MSVDDDRDPESADLKAAYAPTPTGGHLDDEAWERLLEDRMPPAEKAAALDHVVACRVCAEIHRGLAAFEQEAATLDPARPKAPIRKPLPAWTQAVAASLLVLVAGWALLRQGPAPDRPVSPSARPSETATPVSPLAPSSAASSDVGRPSLEELGRIDPPRYLSTATRGNSSDAAFAQAMTRYERGDYAAAARDLRSVARSRPDSTAALFFLGASELLEGQTERALDDLRGVVSRNDPAYAEAARFLAAKALVRRGDLAAARTELEAVVAIDGDYLKPARELIAGIDRRRRAP